MTSPRQPAPAATEWRLVLLTVGAGVVAAMQIGKMPTAMPTVRADLVLGMVIGGWIASVIHGTAAATGVFFGGFVDRVGRYRETLIFGLVAMGVGSLLGGYVESGAMLLTARFLEGIGYIALTVAGPTLLVKASSGAGQRLAFGLWAAFFPIGMAIVLSTSPYLIEVWGWRSLWIANAVVLLGFAALYGVATRTRRGQAGAAPLRKPTSGRDVVDAAVAAGSWLLALSLFAYTAQILALLTWLPTFFVEELGYSRAEASRFTAMIVICQLPGNLGCGWLLNRGLPRWIIVAGALTVVGCLGLAIFAGGTPTTLKIGLACLLSMTGGLVPAAVLAGTTAHAPRPELVGTVNGIVLQVGAAGGLLGPPALALAVETLGGWSGARWGLFAMALIGVVIAARLGAVERKRMASPRRAMT